MNNLAHVTKHISMWQEEGLEIGLATVIDTWGSAPCPVGSMMVVNQRGGFAGGVSGGCVETQVISETLEIIREGGSDLLNMVYQCPQQIKRVWLVADRLRFLLRN